MENGYQLCISDCEMGGMRVTPLIRMFSVGGLFVGGRNRTQQEEVEPKKQGNRAGCHSGGVRYLRMLDTVN